MPGAVKLFTRAELVEYLREAGRPVSMLELAEKFSVSASNSQTAVQRVSSRVTRAIQAGSPIVRLGTGVYQYYEDDQTSRWIEVARENDDRVILQDPDGKLYVARRLFDTKGA